MTMTPPEPGRRPRQVHLPPDSQILEVANKLIARGIYPSSKFVMPIVGMSRTSTDRALRRLREQGKFPARMPRKLAPNQGRMEETARDIVLAYNSILNDGRMPTPRQISKLADVSYTTVQRHLKLLQESGQLAEVPDHVREADAALVNRVKDWTLYKTILKVYSVDREKNKNHARMPYRLIAIVVSNLLGRHVSSDRVGRCLNAIGYHRLSRRPKARQL